MAVVVVTSVIAATTQQQGGIDYRHTSARLVGHEELVFNWDTDRCDDLDTPDSPARAFTDASGVVNLIAVHHNNYRSVGSSLDDVKRDCTATVLQDLEPSDDEADSLDPWEFDG